MARNSDAAPGPTGAVLTIRFQLDGNEFIALNGGPEYKFNEAVSFLMDCRTRRKKLDVQALHDAAEGRQAGEAVRAP